MLQDLSCFLLIKVKEMSQIFPFSRIPVQRRSERVRPRKKDVVWPRRRSGLAGWKRRGSGELRRNEHVRQRRNEYAKRVRNRLARQGKKDNARHLSWSANYRIPPMRCPRFRQRSRRR